MKRNTLFFLLLSGILFLCSCEKGFVSMLFGDNSMKADSRMELILEVLKNKDKEALKEVFSKQALSDASDFDKSLDALFSYIQGDVQSFEITGAYSGKDKGDKDGSRKKEVRSSYIFTTDEHEYDIAIYEYTIDTANPDNVGVYSICIIDREYRQNPKIRYWGNGEAGINIG